MFMFRSLVVALLGLGSVAYAAPAEERAAPDLFKLLLEERDANVTAHDDLVSRQSISSSQTGTHNGYYYSFWTDGGSQVCEMRLDPSFIPIHAPCSVEITFNSATYHLTNPCLIYRVSRIPTALRARTA